MRAGLLGLLLAALLWAAPAHAAELVGNPGPVTLTGGAPGGATIGNSAAMHAVGDVDSDGNLVFPMAGFDDVVFDVPTSQGGSLEIDEGQLTLSPTEEALGTIDPAGGAVSLTTRLAGELTLDATYQGIDFTATCDVAGASDPVVIALGTAPLGSGFDAPVPYDQASGTAVLVGSTSVPAVDGDTCEFEGSLAAQFISLASSLVAAQITDAFDGVPVVLAARFQPAIHAPGFTPPSPPGPNLPITPPSDLGQAPSNVFTLGRAASSPTGIGTIVLDLPGPGAVNAVATANVKAGAARRITVARVKKSVTKAGRVTLRLKPSRRAKAILRKAGRLRSSVKITYTPTGGNPRSSTKALTFKLKRRRR